MVEVVFHVGAHKSATSSLQYGVRNQMRFYPQGVFISPFDRNPAIAELCQFVRSPKFDRSKAQVIDRLLALVDEHAGAERLILSDENIIGPMPGVRWKFYDRAELAREVIDAVAARHPTRVLLQSRETSSFLKSCYQFRLDAGRRNSYADFLELFDIGSISWRRLGATLFDGAAFDWRVLPIEALGRSDLQSYVAERVRFMLPTWDIAKRPIGVANTTKHPLLRAATVGFSRAGRALSAGAKRDLAAPLADLAAKLTKLPKQDVQGLVIAAFDSAQISLSEEMAAIILSQYDEEVRGAGHLKALIAERFKPDYSHFARDYAGFEI